MIDAGIEVGFSATDLVKHFLDDLITHVLDVTEPIQVAFTLGLILELCDLDQHVSNPFGILAIEVRQEADQLAGGDAAIEHENTLAFAAQGGQIGHVTPSVRGRFPLFLVLFYMHYWRMSKFSAYFLFTT